MYCPKCRTEYRQGFYNCADCEIPLVAELPPKTVQEQSSEVFSPALKLIKKALTFTRNNEAATWGFALFTGIIFYFVYLYMKYFWYRIGLIDYLSSLFGESSIMTSIWFTVSFNFIIDLTSSLIASLICGALFVYVLRTHRLLYSLGAVAAFFLVYARKWHFRNAPDIGMAISSLMAPFLVALVFVFIVWLLTKHGKDFVRKYS